MTTTISVKDTLGHGTGVASRDGDKVYELIDKSLKAGDHVNLSFEGIELLTTAFLNSAIGRLYGVYDKENLKKQFTIKAPDRQDKILIEAVIDNAIRYFEKHRIEQ